MYLMVGVGYRGSNLGQCFRTCWAPPSLMTLCVLTPFKKKKRKNCEIQGAPAENVKNPRWPPFWLQKCIFCQNSVIFWSFGLILVSNPMFWGSKKHFKTNILNKEHHLILLFQLFGLFWTFFLTPTPTATPRPPPPYFTEYAINKNPYSS